jgi:hypothetical protein
VFPDESPPVLAEINVARMRHRLEHPGMTGFRDASPAVHLLAEQSPGFLWHARATVEAIPGIDSAPGTPLLVNVSTWADYESLHAFTYPGLHGHYLSMRQRWFVPIPGRTTALWWHPAGDPPTVEHAIARLRHLRDHGVTPQAFTVRRRFPPPRR